MPLFTVLRRRGWYQAECKELGVAISGRDLASVEATARRAAGVGASRDEVLFVSTPSARNVLERVADLIFVSDNRGRGNA